MQENIGKTRIELFDIAKGIAIMAVVLGHVETSAVIHRFIYLWHMLFFVVLAGFFFKEKCYSTVNNLIEFIKKKFIRLMIPYLGFNILFEFLHNFFINIHFYTTDTNFFCSKAIVPLYTNIQEPVIRFFITIEPLIESSWFLYVLFFALIIFAIINFICLKIKYNYELNLILILLFALLIGYHLGSLKFKFMYIGTIFSLLSVLYIGVLFKKTNIKNIFNKYYFLFTSFLLVLFTVILQKNIYISTSQYYNPVLLMILSIISFIFVMSSASLVKNKFAIKTLSFLGQNTIPILLLHCISFKLITYIQILIYNEPIENLAAFKTLHTDGLWWLLYLIAGLSLPLLINIAYKKTRQAAESITNTVFQKGRT